MQRYFVKEMSVKRRIRYSSPKTKCISWKSDARSSGREKFEVVDDASQLASLKWAELEPFEVKVVELLSKSRTTSVSVTIAVGLSKGDKLDWIGSKATELGVSWDHSALIDTEWVKWTGDKSG